ncbi:gliding motility-associated ABC transporter substrate-binding protein GldG [Tenuifilaceae bacterium CYCD]|nr:gliding motility-associated ABC transporter substrate-binding protein GldG [Tenuifilaceae bacterium CYCD]
MNKSARYKGLVRLTIALATIAMVVFLSNTFYLRFDLTSEKRYTLQDITKRTLKDLKDPIYVKIYLDGDLPIGLNRMKKALTESIDEFKVIAGKNIQYEFVNPSESANTKERQKVYNKLYEKGLQPTNIQQNDKEGGSSQKLVFPGLIMNYAGREVSVNLLKNIPGLSGDENINLSVQNFEFALVDGLMKLTTETRPKIAFVQGHGEFDEFQTGDIEKALSEYYDIDRVAIRGNVDVLKPFQTVIIAGTNQPMPEADKIAIDQFVMNGGRVLWFIDPVQVSIDSLSKGASTLAYVNQHNLDDMLFRYGARLNPMLIQDLQCAVIPVNMAMAGQEPKFVPAPWVYYPLLATPTNHPVTRNLNLIHSQFASPVDTVGGSSAIKKQYLLYTSMNGKVLQVPLFVSLSQVNQRINEREFRISNIPVAVELSGEFQSVFRNRPLSGYNNGQPFEFKDKSAFTRMIVVADADIIRNDVQRRPNGAYIIPLGYDRFTNQTFGNKELVMNMVRYLNDDEGLMNLRSRDFKLRLLDRKAILQSRLKWQLINMLIPSAILVIGGFTWLYIRRRKYTR